MLVMLLVTILLLLLMHETEGSSVTSGCCCTHVKFFFARGERADFRQVLLELLKPPYFSFVICDVGNHGREEENWDHIEPPRQHLE